GLAEQPQTTATGGAVSVPGGRRRAGRVLPGAVPGLDPSWTSAWRQLPTPAWQRRCQGRPAALVRPVALLHHAAGRLSELRQDRFEEAIPHLRPCFACQWAGHGRRASMLAAVAV